MQRELLCTLLTVIPATATATDYFVSPDGNNDDGVTWASAWSELDQIDWEVVGACQLSCGPGTEERGGRCVTTSGCGCAAANATAPSLVPANASTPSLVFLCAGALILLAAWRRR